MWNKEKETNCEHLNLYAVYDQWNLRQHNDRTNGKVWSSVVKGHHMVIVYFIFIFLPIRLWSYLLTSTPLITSHVWRYCHKYSMFHFVCILYSVNCISKNNCSSHKVECFTVGRSISDNKEANVGKLFRFVHYIYKQSL